MPIPRKRIVADLKSTILQSAQTSHFEVEIIPNQSVVRWLRDKANNGLGSARVASREFFNTDLKLACHQATLPGSTFATHELNNKYHNVTVKNVYRKQLDQTTSFSFYVDTNYNMLYFFENWMSFMMQEDLNTQNKTSSYRAQFPETYQSNISTTKFEKDYSGNYITYKFLNAYPSAINTMELDYSGSKVLSVTVQFNFSRYIIQNTLDSGE